MAVGSYEAERMRMIEELRNASSIILALQLAFGATEKQQEKVMALKSYEDERMRMIEELGNASSIILALQVLSSLSIFMIIAVIMEYLVKDSKRRAFWSLNEDILKITILKTNTPYPSRKIRRIRACTHQRPQWNEAQYAVSREDQYAVLEIWNEYNILEDIKRGPYSKKSLIRRLRKKFRLSLKNDMPPREKK
ncbi:hypothetical protein Tco_0831217 [Tanacetum coccineum]